MKILVVTHFYSTHAGGIEIVAGRLVAEFSAVHHVAWAASDCNAAPAMSSNVRVLPMRAFNGIEKLTGLPFPLWGPASLVRLWREVGEADVVHVHDVVYPGNWAAFLFAGLWRRPIVLTQHAGLIRYRRALLTFLLRILHRTIGRLLLARATQVVFISPVVREYYQGFVAFRRRPEIVYNGVDSDLYSPDSASREQAAARFGFEASRPVVLFVGRFVAAKGLQLIEEMARRLPDVEFALAGWGPIDPRKWNAPNVTVFSGLRGTTLVPLYRAADLLVLPSLGEGLPLVVQESLACGTPALVDSETARAVGAPAWAVRGCPTGGPEAVDAWTAAVREELRAEAGRPSDRREALGRFARERWSWSATAAHYSELFRRVTAQRERAQAR